MSSVKPISAPTSPLHPTTPSPPKPRDLVTRSLRSCARPQNRDPLFSTACALFLIHNYPDPLCFVIAAHSLPKTPGGSIGISGQIPSEVHRVPLTPTESVSSKRLTLNPIESYSFARIAPKPNGILLFQNDPGGGGTLLDTIQVPLEQAQALVTQIIAISSRILASHPAKIHLVHKQAEEWHSDSAAESRNNLFVGSYLGERLLVTLFAALLMIGTEQARRSARGGQARRQ